MAVVRREHRSHLEITYDGQVDEKPEDAGSDEIPESYRYQEIERPFMRDRDELSTNVTLAPG